jgi:hypothetical protein
VDGRFKITSEETRLELSDPVVAFQEGMSRLICYALLERALCELPIVE